VLLGLFFITIGMMLDWRLVLDRWPLVLTAGDVAGAVQGRADHPAGKNLGTFAGASAMRTGLYLAQAGEFGFVLLTLAGQNNLVPPALFNPILASMVLSMLATPFIIMHSNCIVMKFAGNDWLMQSSAMTTIARKSSNGQKDHVIICGYGRCGQNLARMLDKANIPYMALDLDPDRVQNGGSSQATPWCMAMRPALQALVAAGVTRAKAVVITYIDTPNAMKVLAQIKHLAPDVPVVVRTIDDVNLANLQAAGATEVVPEAIEASLMLASHALALVGVPMRKVLRMVQDQRDARYSLLKGYFHGENDNTPEDAENEHLSTFTVHAHAHCIGKTVDSLALPDIGVRVASLRRVGAQREDCTPDTVLHVGDTLVLSGTTTALAVAEEMLTRRENKKKTPSTA
jgi:CPA2 family monovalent cation:H+ antiporter-2